MAFWWRAGYPAFLLTLCASLLPAQPPTTLRTETRVVQIDVDVRDSHGKPVDHLTRDDFTVTDAGKRREIQIFSVQGTGATESAPSPVPSSAVTLPPNVYSNRSHAAVAPAHATVILMDGINNYWDDFAAARLRLLTTVDKLTKDEPIAIYASSTQPAGVVVVQDFTTDRALLRRTLQAYRPPAITPAPGMISGPPAPPAEEEARRRRAMYDTMSAFRLLSEHLGKLPGRKSLLWLTSGLPPKQLREMPDPYEKAAAALNEANVAVNVVDDDGIGGRRRWGGEAVWTLRNLAESTGGKTFTGRNDLENLVAEAIEAPRIIYTLGFYLPDDERDDKFHALSVRTNRKGLELNYRKGYYAGSIPVPAAPKKREPLENALLDPRESTGIEITAEVTRKPGALRPNLRVAMRLGLSQLSPEPKVEEMFLETDAAGRVLAKVGDVKTISIPQRLRAQFEREGVPLEQEFALMEGAVRLLIVVRDVESGRTGSLSVPLQ